MTLTFSTSKRLLREAVALLDGAPVRGASREWRDARAAFLGTLTGMLDVATVAEADQALAPKTKRGPDRKKRKSWKPKERPLDQSLGSVRKMDNLRRRANVAHGTRA